MLMSQVELIAEILVSIYSIAKCVAKLCSDINNLFFSLSWAAKLDGKSKDLLTMKQNEEEWVEYQTVMEHVVKRSGLDKSIFFDLRGNHDNFGVPLVGGAFDFFSKYSINGQLGRAGNVNSVTLQVGNFSFQSLQLLLNVTCSRKIPLRVTFGYTHSVMSLHIC